MSKINSENPGFTLRAAIIGAALSLFLLTSSTYISLKIGALPWPIVFSVIVSGGLIKMLNRGAAVNIHEVNTAQAGASIGGLLAAGLAFTVPGILYLNQSRAAEISWPNPWLLGIMTTVAGLLGILFSVPLKTAFVDEEKLPYPAGTAGAELLKLSKVGGQQLFFIVMIGAGAGIFALIRDVYFPAGWTLSALAVFGIFITFFPMPLGIGAGYILGPRAGFSWLLGAALGWLIIQPVLFQSGFDPTAATAWVQNLGMGMVLGSGIGFFIVYVLPRIKRIFAPLFHSVGRLLRWLPLLLFTAIAGLVLSGVPVFASVMTVGGVWIVVTIAARMTGETNIDPLEQFGIFVALIIGLVYVTFSLQLSIFASFMIVTFVSVACAVAGDAGHDYKSAAIIGTRFFDIVKMDVIAVIVSGLAAPFVLEIVRDGFADELFTPLMPAPQAFMVAGSITGFEYPMVFAGGFVFAFVLEILSRFLPEQYRNRVLFMPMGIGLFLGFGLAIPMAMGALLRHYVDKKKTNFYHSGLLIAAGVMGGEGIAGFTAGALKVMGVEHKNGALALAVVFWALLLLAWKSYAAIKKSKSKN
ncbi:MAG: OPT/YSL family transporter [bacterium]